MAMIPYEFSAERFSRWMAYVLRHNPERYGLQADRHGFVDYAAFLQIAARRYPGLSAERLQELIESGGSSRFEVASGRLRARYGHSIPVEPVGPPVEPPPALYHGIDADRAEALLSEGLVPMDRRMLHLSIAVDEALGIARRKTEHPAVLRVDAQAAHRAGVAFYQEGAVYLADRIPAAFLRLEPLPASSTPAPPSTPA
ncbi:MAG: RNA 2'-phosphotransferase [Candidatus Omnitrophica bacterium]|nr:RNA 2'-phosphotransferase [Candidatus Omnitrophota bacterium]